MNNKKKAQQKGTIKCANRNAVPDLENKTAKSRKARTIQKLKTVETVLSSSVVNKQSTLIVERYLYHEIATWVTQ